MRKRPGRPVKERPGCGYLTGQHCASETEQQALCRAQQPVAGTAAKAYAVAPIEMTTAIAAMSLLPFFMSHLQVVFQEVGLPLYPMKSTMCANLNGAGF